MTLPTKSRRARRVGAEGEGEAVSRQPKKRKSLLAKRSIYIGPLKTSVCVERAFWDALWEIADAEGLKLSELITRIDRDRYTPNLSSAIRLFVLDHYRRLAEARAAGEPKGKGDGAA